MLLVGCCDSEGCRASPSLSIRVLLPPHAPVMHQAPAAKAEGQALPHGLAGSWQGLGVSFGLA